ncbi:MAG: OmpA family protein [Taibaiella sp.]|nr:OmpA family protein [Taibaiella sp.]
MKAICILFIATMYCSVINAQSSKADRLFDDWEYFRAAKIYEIEAAKHPNADTYFKLGECYRKMHLYIEEQASYDKVNEAGVFHNPEFYLNYGLVLKINGKNDRAKLAFNKYSELVPSDFRGKFYSESIDIVADDHKWDEPVSIINVAALNTKNAEICPVLYKEGILFTSNRRTSGRDKIYGWTGANYLDLFYAQRGIDDLSYTDAAPFNGANVLGKYSEGPACFSKNFDTMYISKVGRDLTGIEKKTLKIERNKIFMSVMKDGKLTNTMPFPFNNDTFSVATPYLTTDGSRIYFASDMPGGYGETDIYFCNREGNGWGKPVNMGPNVNTFNREKYPGMDAAGNFYFSSDGYQGFGGADICVALNNNGTFAKAIPLKYTINSSADDFGIVFLKDGKTGYLTSNRFEGGQGDDDIYYFDLLTNNADKGLATSVYTIGYRPPVLRATAAIPTIAIKPKIITKVSRPANIRIYFDLDKFDIRPDAIIHLDSVIAYMNDVKDVTLQIGGHCDSRATPEYNLNLSRRRTNAALHYLIKGGIKATRMICTGYGASQLVNRCGKGVQCSTDEHQLNRSVNFHFEGKK